MTTLSYRIQIGENEAFGRGIKMDESSEADIEMVLDLMKSSIKNDIKMKMEKK